MINIKDSLVLSDNCKYVVVSKTIYNNDTYLYLVDENNYINFKFCKLDNNKVIVVKDDKLCSKLLPLFIKSSKDALHE